jgi:two-component system NtrC family sensor kinase
VGIPSDKKCYHLLYSRENPCPFCKWENIKNEFTVRWELRREDGKTFDIISSPLKNPDGSLYSMNIMRDITRKKEVEEKYKHMSEETLRANQELTKTIEQLKKTQEQLIQSEKLAAIGKLVSGVAHELNNPLFSAMGYTELLAMDTVYDDGQKEKLDNILSSIKRARGIVKDLLKFARRENVEKELININEVIQQTLTLRKYELRLHNIDVECVLQEDIPTIQGNFVRLQQVLLNIVINAEHAITETDRNGLIKVRSYLDKAKKMVVMNVANNGSEIPPDIMNNIFDPFFTTKDVGKGTGLGLSTSYGIIRDHNGEIAVRSDKNWTVFTVSLPCSVEDMEDIEHEITEESEIKANGESILVVDDEPIIIKLLEDFFKRKGFTVISATSGNEALVKLKKNDVEFIITDIKMPEMDGKQFYDEVKSSKPKLLDRLIFITGDTLNNDTRAFLKKIRGNYLKKPFSFDEITEVLNIVARRNSQMNLF